MLVLAKAPVMETYISPQESLTYAAFTYFYDPAGLKVFQWTPPGVIQAFNGHFFLRYNERMQLGLDEPLEMVKHYFIHNVHPAYKLAPKKNRMHIIGFTTHGLMLGDFSVEQMWVQWRTFVTRDLIRADHDEMEHELILQLQVEMIKAIKDEKLNVVNNKYKLNQLEILTNTYNPL